MNKGLLLLTILILFFSNINAKTIWEIRKDVPGLVQTVNGIALNGSELGNVRYVWDGTAGICVYGTQMSSVNKGDSISVVGTTVDYNNLLELSTLTANTILATNKALPKPELVENYQLAEYNEGSLVKMYNVSFNGATGNFVGNTTYTIFCNGLPASFFIRTSHPLVGQPIPLGIVSVTGICSQYNSNYLILPRTISDIISTPFFISQGPSIQNIVSSGFQIAFTTNSIGNSFVRYGLTSALTSGIIIGSTAATNHTVTLTSLQAASRYYVQAFAVSGTDTTFSVIKSYFTKSTSSGNVRVWFNRPVDITKANPSNNIATHVPYSTMDDSICSIINIAQSTLDIAMYNFSTGVPTSIINAINAAISRGVIVRYIYDYGMPNSALSSLSASVNKIFSPAPASTNDYNIMHNKFLIIDANATSSSQPFLIAGSTNFSTDQLNNDANNVIVIQDQAIAKNYQIEFNEMWGSTTTTADLLQSRFGYYKRDNTAHEFVIGGKRIEVYFSPSDNTSEHINTVLKTANTDLYFANLIFTDTNLSQTIIAKKLSGLFVAGLINDTAYSDHTAFNTMKAALGSFLQLYNYSVQAGILHHKYCIVDQGNPSSDPAVISGSHNWTISANTINDENLLVIHDAAIANQFYQEFISRFNENGGALAINELVNDSHLILFPNPANNFITLKSDFLQIDQASSYITDLLGKYIACKVLYPSANELTFGIDGLVVGIYNFHIKLGDHVITKRFVKL